MALLRAGLVAAARQACAVTTMTVGAWFISLGRIGDWLRADPAADGRFFSEMALALLPVSYLLVATGFAFMRDRVLETAVRQVRYEAGSGRRAKDYAEEVYGRFLMTGLVLVIAELSPAPAFLVHLAESIGASDLGSLVWAGVFSICIAGVGTIAHAGQRALYAINPDWPDEQE